MKDYDFEIKEFLLLGNKYLHDKKRIKKDINFIKRIISKAK